jgi:hypothetical protein
MLACFTDEKIDVVTLEALQRMEMPVSVGHQLVEVVIVLEIRQIRLGSQQVAGHYIADMPSISV